MTEKRENPFPQQNPDHASFDVLRKWWQGLEHDKGERAALKRADSLTKVMLSPAFHRLLRDLRGKDFAVPESRFPKLAAIAGLAARLKKDDPVNSIADRMGQSKPGSKTPVVAELRMRNILACNDLETLYEPLLRRAISLLDNQANLADLAAIVWHWSPMDQKRANDPRRRMAYDYYAAAPL